MYGLPFECSNQWRIKLKRKLYEIAETGTESNLTIINPNDYYNFKTRSHKSEKEIMQYDLNHVRSSDIIIINLSDVNTSIGTAIELYVATQHNIPVLAWGSSIEWENTHPWLKECISRVESTMDDLCEYIKDYYLNV